VDPPKNKFFSAVACPKTDVMELSHPLDQSGQARCHLWLPPLVVNERREQMSVHPLRVNVHMNQEPPLGRISLGALEGGIDIFLSMVATQRQLDPRVDHLIIAAQTVKLPKQTCIWSNP
jgi:hypothetical protein